MRYESALGLGRYEAAKQRIEQLRKDTGPGSAVFALARIRGHYGIWPATLVRRMPSGRHVVEIRHLGKTYRVVTDSTNVANHRDHLQRKDIAS